MKFKKYIVTILFVTIITMFFVGTLLNTARPLGSYIVMDLILDRDGATDEPKVVTKKIDTIFEDNVFLKYTMSSFYTLTQKAMNNRVIEEGDKSKSVYLMNDGYLTFVYESFDMNEISDKIIDFSDYIVGTDTQFVYLQAPFKVNTLDNQLPYGITDNMNTNADTLLAKLELEDVNYIDLRKVVLENFTNYKDAFYVTDHHWKIETAMLCLDELIQYLRINNDTFEDTMEISDLDLIEKELKYSFLGSQGKRVGQFLAGIDDFSYFLPDYDTYITNMIYDHDLELVETKEGRFEDAVMKMELIDADSIITNRYASYLGNDYPFQKLYNDEGLGKILIIKDSFGLPFVALSSLLFEQVFTCDLRYLDKGLLQKIIEENQFDYIVVMYNPSVYGDEDVFGFK